MRGVATVAVIGAGAVGCYYGARLARAGHDVRFLMRRDLEAVRARGLEVRSPEGGFRLEAVGAFAEPEAMGIADWVVCSLKTTSLAEAEALVRPCVGPETRVVALMNGYGVEQRFAEWFGPGRVFGAMAFVCINRREPGVVDHLKYGRLSVGHFEDDPEEAEELAAVLRSANLDVVVAPNLLHARWEKLCWNIPFNGLSVAAGGVTTQEIVDDATLRRVAEAAMRETVRVGNADLAAARSAARLDEDEVVGRLFGLTDTMGAYWTSMALDFRDGRPLEVESILGNPARRAAELGAAVPTVDALYALVRFAEASARG
jgi:2-dehydropantoate 2-reductase